MFGSSHPSPSALYSTQRSELGVVRMRWNSIFEVGWLVEYVLGGSINYTLCVTVIVCHIRIAAERGCGGGENPASSAAWHRAGMTKPVNCNASFHTFQVRVPPFMDGCVVCGCERCFAHYHYR